MTTHGMAAPARGQFRARARPASLARGAWAQLFVLRVALTQHGRE